MCNDIWMYAEDNLYTMEPKTTEMQVCSGTIVNVTRTTLKGIMKVMKFAYHLADARDFKELNVKILKANFSYSLTSPDDVILSVTNSFIVPKLNDYLFFRCVIEKDPI